MIQEIKNYVITCDNCNKSTMLSDLNSKDIAMNKLKKIGWNKLYNGWEVCPECNKRIQLSEIMITVDGKQYSLIDYCTIHNSESTAS